MKISSSILLSLMLACAARAQEAATWQLLPEARVDGSGIFLQQLVQLVVPSSASSASVAAASSAVLPQIRLASAPSPGQTASFSRSQITELAQKNYSGLIVSNWSGATLVRVSRRTRQFSDSDMTELLTATLQRESVRDRGELELHLIKPWAAVPVPDAARILALENALDELARRAESSGYRLDELVGSAGPHPIGARG